MSVYTSSSDEGLRSFLPGSVTQSQTTMVNDHICLCGAKDCAGLSSAFRILGRKDPRSFFHRIPRRTKKACKDRAAIDAIRKAYVNTLFPKALQRPKLQPKQDYYIAKHHFPPGLVLNFQRLPYTLPADVLEEHQVSTVFMEPLSTLLTEPHPCQDSLMVVPNYPQVEARKDLQSLLRDEERSRLYQSRMRQKSESSLMGMSRLLGKDSPKFAGQKILLSRDDDGGDDPTETTCSSTTGSLSESLRMSPTAEFDLWYEQSQRISLPPPPLVRSESESSLFGSPVEPTSFLTKSISSSSFGTHRKRMEPQVIAEAEPIVGSQVEVEKPEESALPDYPVELAALAQAGIERPNTPASYDKSPEEIAKYVKSSRVRMITERKARKRSEWRYLIIWNDTLERRPNTGVFTIPSLPKEKKDSDEPVPSPLSPPTPSDPVAESCLLSTLAAIADSEEDSDMMTMRSSPLPVKIPAFSPGKPLGSDDDSAEGPQGSRYFRDDSSPWETILSRDSWRSLVSHHSERSGSTWEPFDGSEFAKFSSLPLHQSYPSKSPGSALAAPPSTPGGKHSRSVSHSPQPTAQKTARVTRVVKNSPIRSASVTPHSGQKSIARDSLRSVDSIPKGRGQNIRNTIAKLFSPADAKAERGAPRIVAAGRSPWRTRSVGEINSRSDSIATAARKEPTQYNTSAVLTTRCATAVDQSWETRSVGEVNSRSDFIATAVSKAAQHDSTDVLSAQNAAAVDQTPSRTRSISGITARSNLIATARSEPTQYGSTGARSALSPAAAAQSPRETRSVGEVNSRFNSIAAPRARPAQYDTTSVRPSQSTSPPLTKNREFEKMNQNPGVLSPIDSHESNSSPEAEGCFNGADQPTFEVEAEPDTSDSDTDSGNSNGSGIPYKGAGNVAGTPETSAPNVPSGTLVTVLETSHLEGLLGENDDDSDFEEKWDKVNKNAGKAASTVSTISSSSIVHSRSVEKSDVKKNSTQNDDPARSIHKRDKRAMLPPQDFLPNHKPLHGSEDESGRTEDKVQVSSEGEASDSRLGSLVEGFWDSVHGGSNAVDALANLMDDFNESFYEIDVHDMEGVNKDSNTSDVSSSESSSVSSESDKESMGETSGSTESQENPKGEVHIQKCPVDNDQTFTPVSTKHVGGSHNETESCSKHYTHSDVSGHQPQNEQEDTVTNRVGDEEGGVELCPTSHASNETEVVPGQKNWYGGSDNSNRAIPPKDSHELGKNDDLDKSQSTKDLTSSICADDGSDYDVVFGEDSRSQSQNDTLTAEDTQSSHAINTLSSPEEQEEFAHLEMLMVEEDERHEWFVLMQRTLEVECKAYSQILATIKSEADQVDRLMDYSHQAIDVYTKTIAELCNDPSYASTKATDSNDLMIGALIKSYRGIAARFEDSLPGLEESVQDMASYKTELTRSVRVIQTRCLDILEELSKSEQSVRKCWDILEESSSRGHGESMSSLTSRDRWLEEVDYRQAVTKHLCLWRERTGDFRNVTARILEMESECHQRLKDILLDFLPKRQKLFVGVRDLLDPSVDALETLGLLSEMDEVDKRLVQAVHHFQPGKKRSILSLVSSSSPSGDKSPPAPRLDDFAPLAAVDAEVLQKSENVHGYSIVKCKVDEDWVTALAVVTRQHFLHVYAMPEDTVLDTDESSIDQQNAAVCAALENNCPAHSIALGSSSFEEREETVKIRPPKDTCASKDDEEKCEDVALQLKFSSIEEATEWSLGNLDIFAPPDGKPQHCKQAPGEQEPQNESMIVRV